MKNEVKGCHNCNHHCMNHKVCDINTTCSVGSKWESIPDPLAVFKNTIQPKQENYVLNNGMNNTEYSIKPKQEPKSAEEKTALTIKNLKRFFEFECELNFCSKKYLDRVMWYLNTYFIDASQSHREIKSIYEDTEADGYVFCGKCGKMK